MSADGLRVGTLNLASGRGTGGEALSVAELARALAPLASLGLDVVALQEVDTAQPRSGGADQTAVVAEVLGLGHWRSAPTLAGTPGPWRSWEPLAGALRAPSDPVPASPQYGTALLSRAPVRGWRALDLGTGRGRLPLRVPDPRTGRLRWWGFPDEPRVAVAAELAGGVLLAATHLSFAPVTAVVQLRRLRRWLADLAPQPEVATRGDGETAGHGATRGDGATGAPRLAGVRLLAGDLNLPGRLLDAVAPGTSLVRGATYPASAPRLQLDHVLSLGAPVVASGRTVPLGSGDHRALVVDVRAG